MLALVWVRCRRKIFARLTAGEKMSRLELRLGRWVEEEQNLEGAWEGKRRKGKGRQGKEREGKRSFPLSFIDRCCISIYLSIYLSIPNLCMTQFDENDTSIHNGHRIENNSQKTLLDTKSTSTYLSIYVLYNAVRFGSVGLWRVRQERRGEEGF